MSTAASIDYDVVTSDNQMNITDQLKVGKARQSSRRIFHSCCVFRWTKNLTLFKENVWDEWYSSENNNLYVVIGKPGTMHFDHLSLKQGAEGAVLKWTREFGYVNRHCPQCYGEWSLQHSFKHSTLKWSHKFAGMSPGSISALVCMPFAFNWTPTASSV